MQDAEENRDADGGGDVDRPPSLAAYDPPPARPSESDCCGSGCVPCVMDVYDEEYARWERRQAGGGGGDDADRAVRRDLLSATEYKPFAIVSARRLCDDVHAYRFATEPRARGRLPIGCAQHVHVRVGAVSRPYTPVAVGERDCWFDALVECRPGGLFTPGLLRARPGVDAVAVRGPSGPAASHRDDWAGYGAAVAFCAGTGVAAVVRLVRRALDDPACDVLVRLHYTCRTLDRVLLRDELAAFAAYWNCAVRLYLTGEPDWDRCARLFRYGEDVRAGRITGDRIAEIVREQRDTATLWLVCGGREFGRSVVDSLTRCGVAARHVKVY